MPNCRRRFSTRIVELLFSLMEQLSQPPPLPQFKSTFASLNTLTSASTFTTSPSRRCPSSTNSPRPKNSNYSFRLRTEPTVTFCSARHRKRRRPLLLHRWRPNPATRSLTSKASHAEVTKQVNADEPPTTANLRTRSHARNAVSTYTRNRSRALRQPDAFDARTSSTTRNRVHRLQDRPADCPPLLTLNQLVLPDTRLALGGFNLEGGPIREK